MNLKAIFILFIPYIYVFASPQKQPRPLVIWHGLGDSHSSPGMLQFVSSVKDIHPGIFVHSIFIEEEQDKDRKAGFYGNANEHIEFVAAQLAGIPELTGGFDAIGFSQGGQFLRAYVQRYNSPPVNNLITFGSQHMGISDIPTCKKYDFLCQLARKTAKQAVYSDWAQNNLIQAQYFRDPSNYETYLKANHFLTSVNNEITISRNETYARNLASLANLVLVLFTEDITVVPKESAWFGAEVVEDEQIPVEQVPISISTRNSHVVPMRLLPIYIQDWIGLRDLDKRDAIIFEACKGEHMQLGDCWKDLVIKFAGGRD